MNEIAGRRGSLGHTCANCEQTLSGVVRHCPFCGARQADLAISDGTPAPSRQDADAKPLTRWGARAEGAGQPESLPAQQRPPPPAPVAQTYPTPDSQSKATPPEPPRPPPVQLLGPSAPVPVSAVTTEPPPSKFKWIALLILAGVGFAGWEVLLKPKPLDLCQQALESAASSMQANQFGQAKTQALGAVARCTGESQDRAKTVLKAAQAAQAADDNCGKAMRQADSQIAEGRLKLALRTLNAQPGACLNREDATARKQRIDASKASATEKLSQAQTQLSAGQFDQARASVDEAERLDRDNSDVARIRKEIEKMTKEAVAIKEPPPQTSLPPSVIRPPVQAPQSPQSQSVYDVGENNKRLECTILVRTGESALANKNYDDGMQRAQEALNAFVNCPGAQALLQRARMEKNRARQSVIIQ